MLELKLSAAANQEFSATLDERFYNFRFVYAGGCMAVTISRDSVLLVENLRVVAGTPLLPYAYQEAGNFVLVTQDGDLPDYTQFGVTQALLYVTPDEIAALRG
jgi:hypothetical protein